MVTYMRFPWVRKPLLLSTSVEEAGKVGEIIRAFLHFSQYHLIENSYREISFLIPEEAYTDSVSIVRVNESMMVANTSYDRVRKYINVLDWIADPETAYQMLESIEGDKSFRLPEVRLSPLLSYELSKESDTIKVYPTKVKVHPRGAGMKNLPESYVFDYFKPAALASTVLHYLYQSPVACRVVDTVGQVLTKGDRSSYLQSHSDFYNVLSREDDLINGCVYYEDYRGKTLESELKKRKGL
jgi:hypothetical protein